MDDMAATVSDAMSSTRQTASTAQDLVHAALRLDHLVGSSSLSQPPRDRAGRRSASAEDEGAGEFQAE
jgi:hypothetical protein